MDTVLTVKIPRGLPRGGFNRQEPKPFIIPFFIPHAGCPHRCVFCNQVSIAGFRQPISPEQVEIRIREFLRFKGSRRGPVEVAFYGGTFLGLSDSYRDALLKETQAFIQHGVVAGCRFSTRPDTVTPTILKQLAPYTVTTVELGAQSMVDTVLEASHRGHTAQDTKRAVSLLRRHAFQVGLQIMPGLPGDTVKSMLETGRSIAALRPDFVRIYPTVVVRNTRLEKLYRDGRFVPLSLPDAIEVTKSLYTLFQESGIPVVRMGLQATDTLSQPGEVVAGPFHPAFGHLVLSSLLLDRALAAVGAEVQPGKRLVFTVHPKDLSRFIGHERQNIRHLQRRFGQNDVRVSASPAVAENTVIAAIE